MSNIMAHSAGQSVLITGATVGIGLACAEVFASKGFNLILWARTQSKLEEIEKQILSQTKSIKIFSEPVDVSNKQSVATAVQNAITAFGRIDVLINNAGLALGSPKRFWDQDLNDIDEVLNTNVHGVVYTTYEVLNQSMLKNGGKGTIVNISSITGLTSPPPSSGETSYHTSKAALEAFSNVLRDELVGTNIRLIVIRPGFVKTLFHLRRHGFDQQKEDQTFEGMTPLSADDVATQVFNVVNTPENVMIRSIDILPTAQRSLHTLDRDWNERNKIPS